tara:strand:- start:1023 stop:2207 length:1185 start_codon:yes stop_codon:yes gene_type:complete
MSGILDAKSRIIDSVITDNGRSQIARGDLRIEFASFTDAMAYYEADIASGSSDATRRIYFEQEGNKRQDFITFETDDSGNLLGYPTDADLSLNDGILFKKGSTSGSSDLANFVMITDSANFASLAEGIVTSSIDHFSQLYMIGSVPAYSSNNNKQEFNVSLNTMKFTILNTFPFIDGPTDSQSDINAVEPLYADKRLSHIPNFKYLPPLVVEPLNDVFNLDNEKERELTEGQVFFGAYEPLNEIGTLELSYENLLVELNGEASEGSDPDSYEDIEYLNPSVPWTSGFNGGTGESQGTAATETAGDVNFSTSESARERTTLFFTDTSPSNNIVMQMFETDTDSLLFKKLDVIDYGEIISTTDENRPNKHIFFAGKVMLNSINIPTFVNLFTIILD